MSPRTVWLWMLAYLLVVWGAIFYLTQLLIDILT